MERREFTVIERDLSSCWLLLVLLVHHLLVQHLLLHHLTWRNLTVHWCPVLPLHRPSHNLGVTEWALCLHVSTVTHVHWALLNHWVPTVDFRSAKSEGAYNKTRWYRETTQQWNQQIRFRSSTGSCTKKHKHKPTSRANTHAHGQRQQQKQNMQNVNTKSHRLNSSVCLSLSHTHLVVHIAVRCCSSAQCWTSSNKKLSSFNSFRRNNSNWFSDNLEAVVLFLVHVFFVNIYFF